MMVSLDDMAVFERVADSLSFTQAATELGMSKAAVSARVARLEERLGVRLLHRTTRKVRATDSGRAYAERCRVILSDAREADQAVAAQAFEPRGVLRITCPRLFGTAFLTPVLSEYFSTYDHVSVEVVLTERAVDLVEEGFDLAIRIGSLADSSLIARRLGEVPSALVASSEYAYVVRSRVDHADDLHRLDWIGVGRRTGQLQVGEVSVQTSGRVAVDSLEMARDLAVEGLGAVVLPRFVCQDQLLDGRLVEVWDPAELPRYPIYAVYPTQRHLSARVRSFLDLLVERTRVSPPWGG